MKQDKNKIEESNITTNSNNIDIEATNEKYYITSACIKYLEEKFNDKSYELNILRWFRDNFVSIEDTQHYYEVAPIIVDAINREKHSNIIYDYIYDNIVDYCVKQILIGNYENAYIRYKSSALALEENFAKLSLINRFVKTLKNTKNN